MNDKNEKEEPRNDDGGIMMDHSTLHFSSFASCEVVTVSDHVQSGVDDVLLDPSGARGTPIGEPSHSAHETVYDRTIEPVKYCTQTFERLDENEVVEFINIVLVQ